MREYLSILKSCIDNFHHTGTVLPSSKYLADILTQDLDQKEKPYNILEVGAGTGPITKVILQKLGTDDSLTSCEINSKFCDVLRKTFDFNDKQFTLFEGPIQDFSSDHKFDLIICSLPFLNFEATLCEEIFSHLAKLSKPGTKLTYFSYFGLKEIGAIFSKRRRETRNYLDNQSYFQHIENQTVWLNVLPAEVRFFSKSL